MAEVLGVTSVDAVDVDDRCAAAIGDLATSIVVDSAERAAAVARAAFGVAWPRSVARISKRLTQRTVGLCSIGHSPRCRLQSWRRMKAEDAPTNLFFDLRLEGEI